MTRKKAVSLFLVAVLILTISVAALAVSGSQSGLDIAITQDSSIMLTIGAGAPAESGVLACAGCSGGGSTGG